MQRFYASSCCQPHRTGTAYLLSRVLLHRHTVLCSNNGTTGIYARSKVSVLLDQCFVVKLQPCSSHLWPTFQVEMNAVAQNEKSWTDIPGVSPPVRLVVTATPQSQVSNDPILGNDTVPGRFCRKCTREVVGNSLILDYALVLQLVVFQYCAKLCDSLYTQCLLCLSEAV